MRVPYGSLRIVTVVELGVEFCRNQTGQLEQLLVGEAHVTLDEKVPRPDFKECPAVATGICTGLSAELYTDIIRKCVETSLADRKKNVLIRSTPKQSKHYWDFCVVVTKHVDVKHTAVADPNEGLANASESHPSPETPWDHSGHYPVHFRS